MISRDGEVFHRYGKPVIPRTAPKDRNHNRSNYMAWGMFQLPGKPNEISVYGTENYYEPSPGRIRRFVYRTDGFVALRGGGDGGTMTTKPLRFEGEQLLVNFVTRPGGSVVIDTLNPSGNVTGTSEQLSGDAVDQVVSWRHAPKFDQEPVRLRFKINNADVYSMRFR